jgi:ATP-dependent protease HslVU (ClpYQ) ATPase subunit
VRQIEEDLRKAQLDPRLINVVCMMAERQRVQHEQLMGMARLFNQMQDLLSQLIEKMGIRDTHLKKLGVEEMLKDTGVRVESVEEFDEDKGTH